MLRGCVLLFAFLALPACSEPASSPVADAGVTPIAAPVEAIFGAVAARTTDHRIYFWGKGYDDRITGARWVEGHGEIRLGSFPGTAFTCAALTDGHVACWGTAPAGGLGTKAPDTCHWDGGGLFDIWDPPPGDYPCANEPTVLPGVEDAVQVDGSCAVTSKGTVFCWPYHGDGTPTLEPMPKGGKRLRLPQRVRRIVSDHIDVGRCFFLADGSVACDGSLPFFEAPDGCPYPLGCAEPTVIPSLAGARDLSLGFGTSCAVMGDGQVVCGGARTGGARGDGLCSDPMKDDDGPPTAAKTDLRFQKVSASVGAACGITEGGALACWGSVPNSMPVGGAIYGCPSGGGDGYTSKLSYPTLIPDVSDLTDLALVEYDAWVLRKDGYVFRIRDPLGGRVAKQMAP